MIDASARRQAIGFTAVVALAVVVRLAFFGGLLGWDDAEYMEAASAFRRGDFAPVSTVHLRYGIVVPLAAVQAALGETELAAAVLPFAWSILAVGLAYALGRLFGGPPVALVAAGIVAILPLEVIGASDLHADVPAGVALAATIYAVVRADRADAARARWLLAGGVAFGIAYVMKEIAVALVAVLVVRWAWRRTYARDLAWFAAGFAVVAVVQGAWLARLTGDPFFMHSATAFEMHAGTIRSAPPGYAWMLQFPAALLHPLAPAFGYFAGLGFLVIAGTIWMLRHGHPGAGDLLLWWGVLFLAFNFAPLDRSFTRPLFHHWARTLHPVVIPFAVVAAVWIARGLGARPRLRAGVATAFVALAGLGVWSASADHRAWATPARAAARVFSTSARDGCVSADVFNARLLRLMLPADRERFVVWSDPGAARTACRFVLYDPVFARSAAERGHRAPPDVLAPPSHWRRVAEFTRPPRPSLRSALFGGARPAGASPVVLWRTDPAT